MDAVVEQKESVIEKTLNEQNQLIEDLGKTVEVLYQRTEPIRLPIPQTKEDAPCEKSTESRFVTTIQTHNHRISNIRSIIL